MKVNQILKFIEARHLVGTSKKTGNPYDLVTLTFMDDDFNKIQMTAGTELVSITGEAHAPLTEDNRGKDMDVTFDLTPDRSGYGLTAIAREIQGF